MSTIEPQSATTAANAERILIGIATYNERDNLEPLVRAIHSHVLNAEVLVIDDHSPDGTGELADRLAAEDGRVHVLHRPGKLGLGTAVLDGMRWAMARDYTFFVTMDADFSHHPRYLSSLLAGMKGRDLMIGSRYVSGGGTLNWPLKRQLMSKGVNSLARFLMRIPARDTSGNYRCYRVARLRGVPLHRLLSHGYSFQEEVLYLCHKSGMRLGETPIIFEDRRVGATKANTKEMVRSLSILVYLGLGAMFGFK